MIQVGLFDGFFGTETKTVGGIVYALAQRFSDKSEAEHWANQEIQSGNKVKLVPNPKTKTFDLYVALSERPDQPPTANIPQQGQTQQR